MAKPVETEAEALAKRFEGAIVTTDSGKRVLKLTDSEARGLKSYEDVAALWEDLHEASEAGDGFQLLKDKQQLVGKAFVVLDYKLVDGKQDCAVCGGHLHTQKDGDFGPFVVLRVITKSNEKLRLTDGSTGILEDILSFHTEGVFGGIIARHGLSVSEYTYTDDDGSAKPAKTFYLDASA